MTQAPLFSAARTRQHTPRTKNNLRCFCARRPLLAVYGLDVGGRLYVHVMVYKQDRVYGNIVLRGGPVELQCRECLRWHVVNFAANQELTFRETDAPVEVEFPPRLMRRSE